MTNSESTSFAVPQHPLPEEIQQMKRDETVCKFCGVSYLIHNEVKALQEKLAATEKQMQHYKGSVEREKLLIEKMKMMDAESLVQSQKMKEQEKQLELFKSDLKMKAKLINDMYTQKCNYESSLKEQQSKCEKLSARIVHLSSTLQHCIALVKQQKECLNSLMKDVVKHKMFSKEFIQNFGVEVNNIVAALKKKVIQERDNAEFKMKKMNEQLLSFQNELHHLQTAENKLQVQETKYTEIQNKLNIYEKHVNQLEEKNEILKNKNTTVESRLIEKSKQEKDLKDSLEIVKTEKQEEHLKYEQLLTKKDEEVKKLNNLCKSLEKLMNEKSAAEKEVREKVTDKDAQLKNIEETINEMRVESGKLKMEREQTIIAHHNRIEQLRESYANKLKDSETNCQALQNELNDMKRKYDTDIKGWERSLKENFTKEISNLNTKHSEEIDLLEIEIKGLKEKLEQDSSTFRDLKEEINQLKNTLSTNKARNAQTIQKYQNEIFDLKKSIDVLQHKKDNEYHNNDLTSKYQAIQKTLQDTKNQINIMEQKLISKNNEMTILQDTVRRECEERLELTQALSDTRMQLLSLQKNSDATGHFLDHRRLNRPTINNADPKTSASYDISSSETCDIIASRVRRIKSTGSEKAARESVDSFRERIAAALGRENRANHTR